MKSSDKFEQITDKINKLTLTEIHTFCWLLLGGTSAILEKKNINKRDVLLTYENALKHLRRNNFEKQ
jgi:hypothetical protein